MVYVYVIIYDKIPARLSERAAASALLKMAGNWHRVAVHRFRAGYYPGIPCSFSQCSLQLPGGWQQWVPGDDATLESLKTELDWDELETVSNSCPNNLKCISFNHIIIYILTILRVIPLDQQCHPPVDV